MGRWEERETETKGQVRGKEPPGGLKSGSDVVGQHCGARGIGSSCALGQRPLVESVAAATQSQVSQPCCCGYLGILPWTFGESGAYSPAQGPDKVCFSKSWVWGKEKKKEKTVQESSSIPVPLGEVLSEETLFGQPG